MRKGSISRNETATDEDVANSAIGDNDQTEDGGDEMLVDDDNEGEFTV